MVTGQKSPSPMLWNEALDGERLAKVIKGNHENSHPPRVIFSEEGLAALSVPYKEAIVVKVLGKHMSYTAMVHKMGMVWRLKGGFQVLDVGNGYFLVKFDAFEDQERVLLGGPWMISGFYLAVKPWSPEFYSEEEVFGSTMVWVRFYGLGIRYYHEKAMLRIAAAVGKPVKVDVATKMAARGKYARACVEIDLGVPITRSVEVDGRVLDVEYESLELVCNTCGCYGHVGVDCKLISSISANIDKTGVNEDKEQDHEKIDQVPFSSNIEKPFVFGSTTIGIEKNKDKEVHVMEGAHAGDTTWTKVERKAKGKKVFLGRHDQDKSKKVYVDKSSNYVAKGEPAMKGINVVELALHISKGNQVLKQARNFKLASSGFTSAQGVTGGKQGPGSEWAGAYSQGAGTSKTSFKSNLKRLRPNSLQNSPVENGHSVVTVETPFTTLK
ncbi:RNA-directed DNA polymerase [Arachis hypogaea]|nr:RNA-directed DNA polymerase [Arachis hypogaea]